MEETIRNFILSKTGNLTFSNDDDIFAMGFVNSLFAMQLVNFIEQEFEIMVGDDDLDISNFNTVNNIAALVRKNRNK